MRNDRLSLLQEAVGHGDAFVQQTARILAQVEDQTLDILFAQPPEVLLHFLAGVLVELTGCRGTSMPGFSQNASSTLLRGISSRMMLKMIGLSAPSRAITICTWRAARAFQQVGDFGGRTGCRCACR